MRQQASRLVLCTSQEADNAGTKTRTLELLACGLKHVQK